MSTSKGDENKGGATDEGLSIEEMNRLRIQLGLKPLYVPSEKEKKEMENKIQNEQQEMQKTLHIQEELEKRKKEREYTKSLSGKTLAQEIEDESVSSWIEKMKQRAIEREMIFENEDEELEKMDVQEDKNYRIHHDFQDLKEGEEIVLNLKDQNVLEDDFDEEEVGLVNESITTTEKDRRNKELKKKKPIYNPYDTDNKSILPQYDDEKAPSSFLLNAQDTQEEQEEKQKKIRAALKIEEQRDKKGARSSDSSKIASEYYDEEEMNQLFKPKKKKSKKKESSNKHKEGKNKRNQVLEMLKKQKMEEKQNEVKEEKVKEEIEIKKEIDIKPKDNDNLQEREKRYKRAIKKVVSKATGEVEGEDNDELYEILSKSRKRKTTQEPSIQIPTPSSVQSVAQAILERKKKMKEKKKLESNNKDTGMVFTSTTEFVKGMEVEDFEDPIPKKEIKKEPENPSSFQSYPPVNIKKEKQDPNSSTNEDDKMNDESEGDDDEDDNSAESGGLASTLNFLKNSNYSEKDSFIVASRFTDNSSIKKEIFGYKEDKIDLRKFDEFGRLLTPKEAFRDLSHRFHGKGSGKNKSEKRLRKYHQQLKLNQHLSSENVDNTLSNLENFQKKSGKAFVQLTLGSQAMQELTQQTSEDLGKHLQENIKKKRNNNQKK